MLVPAATLRLRPSAATLVVRLATTPTNFRPRRTLWMWRSLLTRRHLHLRSRGRLTTAGTATIELARRRLRRARPLSRRHVVHFPRLRS